MDYDLVFFTNINLNDIKESDFNYFQISHYLNKLKLIKTYECYNGNIENIILDSISNIEEKIFKEDCFLQIGIYISSDDFFSFSIKLSKILMSKLSEKNISIDISLYPCSES